MYTLENLKKQRQTLKAELEKEKFKTRTEYNYAIKKWNNLNSKIRNYNNITNVMKRNGLKVSKHNACYKVEFKGFEALVFEDGCETSFWSIDVIKGNLDFYSKQYDTKKEAIYSLYCCINNS